MNTSVKDLLQLAAEQHEHEDSAGNKDKDTEWFLEYFRRKDSESAASELQIDSPKLSKFSLHFINWVHSSLDAHLRENAANVAATKMSKEPLKAASSAPDLVDLSKASRRKLGKGNLSALQVSFSGVLAASPNLSSLSNMTSPAYKTASLTSTPVKHTPRSPWNHSQRSMGGEWATPPASLQFTDTPNRGGGARFNRSFQSAARTPQQVPQQRATPKSSESQRSRNNSRLGGGGGGGGNTSSGGGIQSPCLGDFLVVASNRQKNKKGLQHMQQRMQKQQQQSPEPGHGTPAKEKKRVQLKMVSAEVTKRSAAQKAPPTTTSVSPIFRNAREDEMSFGGLDDSTFDSSLHEALANSSVDLGRLAERCGGTPAKPTEAGAQRLSLPVVATPVASTKKRVSLISVVGSGAKGSGVPSSDSPCGSSLRSEPVVGRPMWKSLEAAAKRRLEAIACVYSTLIDLNMCGNMLNELNYMVHVLHAGRRRSAATVEQVTQELRRLTSATEAASRLSKSMPNVAVWPKETPKPPTDRGMEHALQEFKNTLYFAYTVLHLQRHQIALLDLKTLSALLDTVRLYGGPLLQHLLTAEAAKQQLNVDRLMVHEQRVRTYDDVVFQSVSFDEDFDSRQNFRSNADFAAFKNQRDLFYRAFQRWDYLTNIDQKLTNEITPLIRDIVGHSESPTNMTHLARLFVAQLVLSANNAATVTCSTAEQIGVTIEGPKLNYLMQRLVQPSTFNRSDFPGVQEFFVHFINVTPTLAFHYQLKYALYDRLLALQDMGQYTEPRNANSSDPALDRAEYTVQWDVMATMMLLAKFLGYVAARPYSEANGCGAPMQAELEQQQISWRNHFQHDLDVRRVLAEAQQQGKLAITLPWVVQYLIMLDGVTLKLDGYRKAIDLLCSLYMQASPRLPQGSGSERRSALQFIVRCCIGWLFEEKPFLLDLYYDYQARHEASGWPAAASPSRVPADDFNANLECLITVACPFLSRFRASLPALQRKGDYRRQDVTAAHTQLVPTTTPFYERAAAATPEDPDYAAQNCLISAFIHSLNQSKRKKYDFLVDCLYKEAIKDARLSLLMPAKAEADADINALTSDTFDTVAAHVVQCYDKAQAECLRRWPQVVEKSLVVRIPKALDALMPSDLSAPLKLTYAHAIHRDSSAKVESWRRTHLLKPNFFCSDPGEVARKIIQLNERNKVPHGAPKPRSTLTLKGVEPQMSVLMHELQQWLHLTSMRPQEVADIEGVMGSLQRLKAVFVHESPTLHYYYISVNMLQLTHNLLRHKPQLIDARYIRTLCELWHLIERADPALAVNKLQTNRNDPETPGIYETLVSAFVLRSFGTRQVCYDKFEQLLLAMLGERLITLEFLNESFVPLFKEDWDPRVLHMVSLMLRRVSAASWDLRGSSGGGEPSGAQDGGGGGGGDSPKSALFMEVLADFAADNDWDEF